MNLEKEIFKKSNIDFDKLLGYGFVKQNDKYLYQVNILNNKFQVNITIDLENQIKGKVIDLKINDEYLALNIKCLEGTYVNTVRNEYINILKDIRNKCCNTNMFMFSQTNEVVNYIYKKYQDKPVFLWDGYHYGVFKNKNHKWYSIIMDIDKSKITNGQGIIEIINLKVKPEELADLLKVPGIYPAYHMNKKHWLTIILDNTVSNEQIYSLIDKSYELVKK